MKTSVLTFIIILLLFIAEYPSHAQVTMGSNVLPHPSAMLDLKPLNKDKGFLVPRIELADKNDRTAINNPVRGLLIFNTVDSGSGESSVYKDKFYYWTGQVWEEFISQDKLETVLKENLTEAAVPSPAIYYLNGTDIISDQISGMLNLLKNVGINQSVAIPMQENINYIKESVSLKEGSGNILVFQPGVYHIQFSYMFIPTDTGPDDNCKISSYYMEFPFYSNIGSDTDQIRYVRTYSNSYHNSGIKSAHAASINFISCIKHPTEWNVELGVGSAGNCISADGLILSNRNTFLYITKIGEWIDK